MNRQTMRVVTGATLLAGCLLLQGCGLFGNKGATPETVEPLPADNPAVEVQPIETTPPAPAVVPEPVQLPPVAMSTPYSIAKGDTISGIAYRYGLRWQDVVAVNPGINPRRLRIGQIIQLPGQVNLSKPVARPAAAAPRRTSAPRMSAPKTAKAAAPVGKSVTYVVRSGDSLSLIAHRFGVKIADVRSANSIKGDRINVGQKLKIVNPKKSYTPTVTRKPLRKSVSATNVKAPKFIEKSPKATTKSVAPVEKKLAPQAVKAEPQAPAKETAQPAQAPAVVEQAEPAPEKKSATPPMDVYTVKEGEDLYAIAIRWGVTPSKLRELNNLSVDADLKPGQTLKIPPQAQ